MVKWFDRTPREALAPLLRPRKTRVRGDLVLLQDLRPDPIVFLGQAAALQLAMLQLAGQALREAPALESKARLTEVLRIISTRAQELLRLLEQQKVDPAEAMLPFLAESERFVRATSGRDWYELLLSLHVNSGMLIDFYVAYAGGLPEPTRSQVVRVMTAESGHPILSDILRKNVENNPRLSSRLGVWGRRLVGDALLQMYIAVNGGDQETLAEATPGEGRLEPAFDAIVAGHSRRMEVLGLTP